LVIWEAVKQSVQPVAGEGWYASNGPRDLLHCGTGEDGRERAERIAKLLNQATGNLMARDAIFRDRLMEHLRTLNNLALAVDPQVLPKIPTDSPWYPVLAAVQKVKAEVVELQKLLLKGPSLG
jgi:hypothetical protein